MPNTYTIKITNEDKWIESTNCYIYQAPIKSKATLYVSLYQCINIGAMESGTITIVPEPYAIVATTPRDDSDPDNMPPDGLSDLQARPVKLTKRPVKGSIVKIDCNTDHAGGKKPFFDDAATTTTTMDGSFRITTSTNIAHSAEEMIVMGMGLKNPQTEEIVPVALCYAIPDGTLTFTPELNVYYIALGDFTMGNFEKMDYVSYSWFTEIDFRGKPPGSEIAVTWRRNPDGNCEWVRH
ncbi:hypothetical protein TWF192_004421 [Orbilia oligospora]|uniref:Uncharacterized protein n=1 Tax=Orbilia oligospora TaxID=2813651 RepID=A0A6G1MDS9_ORBOL|nr:hypothetical protein TWF191_004707 [Orbilia oligospora]KAF3252619.1 hypothetical protein TWF192_004421 [Orbilia oligospora]